MYELIECVPRRLSLALWCQVPLWGNEYKMKLGVFIKNVFLESNLFKKPLYGYFAVSAVSAPLDV